MNTVSCNFRHAFGVALVMLGLPLAWLARDFLGFHNSQAFSGAFLFAALLLTTDFKNLSKIFSTSHEKSFLGFTPLLFVLPAMFFCLLSDATWLMLYIILTAAFCVLLQTVPWKKVLMLPQAFVIVGFLTCFSIVLFLLSSGYAFNSTRLVLGETASPGFLGYVAALTFSSSLFFFSYQPYRQMKWISLLAKLNLILGPFVLLITLSRSQYIGISFTVCFLLTRLILSAFLGPSHTIQYKNYSLDVLKAVGKRKSKGDNLWAKLLIAGISILTLQGVFASFLSSVSPKFFIYYNQIIFAISRGAETYTGASSKDPAALTRYNNIQYALENLSDVGHGFMSMWLDCPVLQSYYDGGLLGFLVFTAITLCIPAYLILKALFLRSIHPICIFSSCLYLTSSPIIFLHGHPYSYVLWINVIPLYSVFCIRRFKSEVV